MGLPPRFMQIHPVGLVLYQATFLTSQGGSAYTAGLFAYGGANGMETWFLPPRVNLAQVESIYFRRTGEIQLLGLEPCYRAPSVLMSDDWQVEAPPSTQMRFTFSGKLGNRELMIGFGVADDGMLRRVVWGLDDLSESIDLDKITLKQSTACGAKYFYTGGIPLL